MAIGNDARIAISSGDELDVRSFSVEQGMSQLFSVEVLAVSRNHDIDFDSVIGNDARFELDTGWSGQSFSGVCLEIEQVRVDSRGLATYRVVLAPRLWLLTQRRNYRIFQYASELEIVQRLLGEWGVEFESRAQAAQHKGRKYRVQYDETDYAFACRMLEDAGLSFHFEASENGTKVVLDDEPQSRELARPSLRYHDRPSVTDGAFVTQVEIRSRLRPGKMTIGDLDFRRSSTQQPRLSATGGLPQEASLEQFDYEPGAFLYQTDAAGKSPTADDRGVARTDEAAGARKTENRLHAHRQSARVVELESNVLDLAPGVLFSVLDHPHSALDPSKGMLVTRATLVGEHDGDWRVRVEAVSAAVPYRPALVTPKPKVRGLESATVVGPPGEEIYTDEFARVRVHFHWDRESQRDESSSCWVPTNQPWAGDGFGAVNVPRIGQEVLIEFLGADPDRPVIVGRVFTETNPVPAKLPKYKHVSGIMSEATPRLVMGAADGAAAGASGSPFGGTPLSSEQMNGFLTEPGPFRAASPTGGMHQWRGSGMQLDDFSNAEINYIQANRDLHMVVYNNWTTVVGNHRVCRTGTDDILRVRGDQAVRIDAEQRTTVARNQMAQIEGKREDRVGDRFEQEARESITMVSQVGNVELDAVGPVSWNSGTTVELRVRNSVIKLSPTEILVQSGDNNVLVNPVR